MEDENGLVLSLGLCCGASSVKSKGIDGSSSDVRTEDGKRANRIVDDFRNFLNAGGPKHESTSASQRENFFNDLSKASSDTNASINSNGQGQRIPNNITSAEIEEEKLSEGGKKRKMQFNEINHHKKLELEAYHADLQDKARTSHISITEDGSTAENEDVAESEVEVSTSKLALHHDDSPKQLTGVGCSSEVSKEVHGLIDSNAVEMQKILKNSSENEFKIGNFSGSFPVQSVNVVNVAYSLSAKESNSVGSLSTSSHPRTTMMQAMPTSTSERPGIQPASPANLPLMLGYSPIQLPMLNKDNSWALLPHAQQLHSSYVGRGPSHSVHVVPLNSSDAAQYDGRMLDQPKADGKQQQAVDDGSSSLAGEDPKGGSLNSGEGTSFDFPAIKPGLSADVKFGGCGSYPNLPWVSTTGPNGRTISGVTYRYNVNQVKIVCACHGSHMTPEEFVRHANEENVNQDNGAGLSTFPSNNPAGSAQS